MKNNVVTTMKKATKAKELKTIQALILDLFSIALQ